VAGASCVRVTRLHANGDEYRNTVSVKGLKVELWGTRPDASTAAG